ncbi:MAG: arsenate reductase (glutaredoxin) [Formosimonas sp.]
MVTIYHNPKCSKSCETLALLRSHGVEPEIIEYLHTPPSRETLQHLIQSMGLTVRDVLRTTHTEYEDLHLESDSWSDDGLIDAILTHPILLQRPIVVTDKGVRLCRPAHVVLEIL